MLLLGLAMPARAVVDPTLMKIVDVVAIGLGEPGLKDAVPLIDCVIKLGPAACVDVKSLAEAEGKKAVKPYLPDDPKVKAAVEIIKAAYAQDYFKVLEVGGVKFLPPLACGLAFQVSGPLKALICNEQVFNSVSSLSGPVFKQLIVTVKNPSPGNLWGLVTVMDADLACSVVKTTVGDFPGLDEVCGPLGKVIEFAKDVGEEAAKAGKEAGEFLLQKGEDIVNGVGDALESACEWAGLCDSGGKKLMSGNEYYKYRLFPLIHDRVVARLVKGQQHLGHDNGTMQACLGYYMYDLYSQSALMKDLAPKVKKGCEDLGARLHKEADTLAQAFAAAPQPYFETSVKALIPSMAVEGYGQNKTEGYRKFVVTVCVTNMRKALPIIEPSKPGMTGWSFVCNKVGGLFTSAYQAEEQKLVGSIKNLVAAGCFPPAGWSSQQGLKLECSSYAGYKTCLEALSPGLEKKHCTVNVAKADDKLAADIASKLGHKRCHASGVTVLCSRPWKQEKCKTLLAQQMTGPASASKVQCKPDMIPLAAFAALSKQAENMVFALNGGMKQDTGMKTDKGEGLVMFVPPSAKNCKTTWDPLAITCTKQEILAAHPDINLATCAPDPNEDGADAPCYAGPLSAKMAQDAIAKSGVKAGASVLPVDPETNLRRAPATVQESSARSVGGPVSDARAANEAPLRGLAALPDLSLTPQVMIGNRMVNWGGTVSLQGNEVASTRGGGCEATIQTTLINYGTGASGPFESVWKIAGARALSNTSMGLPPGGTDIQRNVLQVRPGMNVLELAIDASGRVQESNEANNQYRLVVNLASDCMMPVRTLPAPASGPAVLPPTQRETVPPPVRLPLPTRTR